MAFPNQRYWQFVIPSCRRARPASAKLRYHASRRLPQMSTEPESLAPAEEMNENHPLRWIGWFSVGMAVAALGIYLGAEWRNRSKFKKRTPYDFYSNAGERHVSEFGIGI
jgi:hypothetical protein